MRLPLILFLALIPFADTRANISAEDPQAFGKCWDYKTTPNISIRMAADASNVYFVDSDNILHATELSTGAKIWSSELGGEVVSNVHVYNDHILVVTSAQTSTADNGTGKALLRSLSKQTGITEWRTEVSPASSQWLGSVGANLIAVGDKGAIQAIEHTDGKILWRTDLSTSLTSDPTFTGSAIEIGTKKNEVVRIDGSTGAAHVVWKAEFLPTSVVSDAGGRLVIGDERGNVTLLSSDGERAWVFRNGAQISSTALYGSEYLVTSYDNFLYMLSRSGGVRWKRRLSGRAADAPLILNDSAVVPIIGASTVYVLDLRNGKISNRIELGEELSLRVVAIPGGRGFVIAGPLGLAYYSDKCPANKKTTPASAVLTKS